MLAQMQFQKHAGASQVQDDGKGGNPHQCRINAICDRKHTVPDQGSWRVTDSAGMKSIEVSEKTTELLEARGKGAHRSANSRAQQDRDNAERRYTADIQ